MNQLVRMQAHANQNTASTVPAITYARRLAAEGKSDIEISLKVRSAGYRLSQRDAELIWYEHQKHLIKLRLAMRAGS